MYGFGASILNWIKTFFSNRDARVMMRQEFTERITLGQGVPYSPYIFILAIYALLIKIMYTKNIKGITDAGSDSRGDAFADDINLYMERKSEYLQAALDYFKAFSEIFGLVCNLDKTKIVPIGNFDT